MTSKKIKQVNKTGWIVSGYNTMKDRVFREASSLNSIGQIPDLMFLRGILYGVYQMTEKALSSMKLDELPSLRSPTKEEKKKYAPDEHSGVSLELCMDFFDKTLPVYSDDDGQCYCVESDDSYYGLGTFNSYIEPDIACLILTSVYNEDDAKLADIETTLKEDKYEKTGA